MARQCAKSHMPMGWGQRPRRVPQVTMVRSLTGRLHSHTLTPGDSSNPSPTPQSGRTMSPGPEALPEPLAGEDCVCPSGGPQGGGAASTGGCAIPWTCGGGRSGGCSPEPCGAHAGAHSTLGACTRMCAAMGMQGSTARATLLPGPCSLHSVPGSPGTGMHEGLGGGCPCWEVMRGAGATGS